MDLVTGLHVNPSEGMILHNLKKRRNKLGWGAGEAERMIQFLACYSHVLYNFNANKKLVPKF